MNIEEIDRAISSLMHRWGTQALRGSFGNYFYIVWDSQTSWDIRCRASCHCYSSLVAVFQWRTVDGNNRMVGSCNWHIIPFLKGLSELQLRF